VHWLRHRNWLAVAALLDALGIGLLAVAIEGPRFGLIKDQLGLLAVLVGLYLSLGWLFGSFSVLRSGRLPWIQLVLRVGITSVATVTAGVLLGWLLRASPTITLLHRATLLPLFGLGAVWSGGVRVVLRRLSRSRQGEMWQIVTLGLEQEAIRQEWLRLGDPPAPLIQAIGEPEQLAAGWPSAPPGTRGLALSAGLLALPAVMDGSSPALAQGRPITSLAQLAELELQRIPPRWVGDQWLLFSDRIEGSRSGFEKQLKRYADVMVSLLLLVLCAPLLLLAGALIHLHDRGPVLYRQRRTGLLGQPFEVIKLRTMVPQAEAGRPRWSTPNDSRITPVGLWLRRTRLDELPQLLNVLSGEMSLIGPRPERPELEKELERRIPHYRLRHWVRPGLSGWAQVNMPYTSSVEDAELKLSYDLFYLRNSGIWLDLLILLKTIKTVLKAAGR
jgi:lipopolysaccharide/colanic/teichoic acid biosynthesis glycosyltransferase